MNWKELKKSNYKNYTYCIYGKYTEDHPTYIDGEIKYKESIETKVEIKDSFGRIVHEMDWLEYQHLHDDKSYEFLIRFRPVYKEGIWYELFPKVVDVIHIETEYYRAINDWCKYCESVINKLINLHDKRRYEQEMTDGLPDSLFIKYSDR